MTTRALGTLQSIVREIYTADLLAYHLPPAPPSRVELMHLPDRDEYRIAILTYRRDGRVHYSQEPLQRPSVAPGEHNERRIIEEIDRVFRRALQRHFFLLAHARGGYS